MSPDWSAKEEPVPYAKMDDPQTLNLYAYLMNNPLAGVDSDGHCPPGVDGANCNNVKVTAQVTTPAKVLDQAHLVDADGKPQGPSISGVAGGITLTVTENGKPIKGVSASETNTITATEDGKPISNTHQDTTYTTKKDGKIPDTVGLVLPTPTKKEGDAIAAEFSSYPIRVIDSQRLILQVPRVGSCSYSDVRTLQNFGADSRIVAPFSLTTTQPQPAQ